MIENINERIDEVIYYLNSAQSEGHENLEQIDCQLESASNLLNSLCYIIQKQIVENNDDNK